jgi:hypothetical protein
MDEVFYFGEVQFTRFSGRDKAELFAGEVLSLRDHLALSRKKLWSWEDRLIDGKTTGIGKLMILDSSTIRCLSCR